MNFTIDLKDVMPLDEAIAPPKEPPQAQGGVAIPEKQITTVDTFVANRVKKDIIKDNPDIITVYDGSKEAYNERVRNAVSSLIQSSDNPNDTEMRIKASALLASITNIDWAEIYNNFDEYSYRLLGDKLPPHTAWQVAKTSIENGIYQTKAAKLAYSWAVTGDENALKQAQELLGKIKPETYKHDSLFKKAIAAFGEQIPNMLSASTWAAVGGLAASLIPVPGATAVGAAVGGTIGAGVGAGTIEAGSTVLELMQLTDKEGHHVNPNLVRYISLVAGGLKGIIEVASLKELASLIPGGQKVFNSIITRSINDLIKGGFIKTAILKTTAHEASEVAQEVSQEIIDVFADKVAAGLSKYPIDTQNIQEIRQRLIDIAKQTALAVAVPVIPTVAGTTFLNTIQERAMEQKKIVSKGAKTSDLTRERITDMLKPVEKETPVKAEATGEKAGSVIVTSDKNNIIANAKFEDEETKTNVYNLDTAMPEAAQMALSRIEARNIEHGRAIDLIGDAEKLVKLVENQDPILARINQSIDEIHESLKSNVATKMELESKIAELEHALINKTLSEEEQADIEGSLADYRDELNTTNDNINRLVEEEAYQETRLKEQLKAPSVQDKLKLYKINGADFNAIVKGASVRETIAEVNLFSNIKSAYKKAGATISNAEAQAATMFFKIYAHGKGMTLDQFLKKYPVEFDANNQAILKGHRAAIRWNPGGEAIIAISKSSNMHDIMHEFFHLVIETTDNETLKPILDYLGHKKWTAVAHEDAVRLFEKYISNPQDKAIPSPIRKVLNTILDTIKYIYAMLSGNNYIRPDIKQKLGQILYGTDEARKAETIKYSGILYEPNLQERSLDDWKYILMETDEYVPDEILKKLSKDKGEVGKIARQELKDREEYKKAETVYRNAFPDLVQEAENFNSYDDFANYIKALYPDEEVTQAIKKLSAVETSQGLKSFALWDVWRAAHLNTVEDGNRIWISNLTDNFIKDLLKKIKTNYNMAANMGFHGLLLSESRRRVHTGLERQQQIEKIREFLTKNVGKYRELVSRFLGDDKEMMYLARERGINDYLERKGYVQAKLDDVLDRTKQEVLKDINKMREALKKDDYTKIITGNYDEKYLDTLLRHASRELKRSEREILSAQEKLKKAQSEYNRLKNWYHDDMKVVKSLQAELKTLQKDKTKNEKQIAKLQERIQKREQQIKEVKEKQKAYKEALSSAKKEYRMLIRERKAAERAKAYRKKLIKALFRKPARNVHFDYKKQIMAIQNQFTKNKSKLYTMAWKQSKDFYRQHPEVHQYMTQKAIKELSRTPINLIETSQIETLVRQIDKLEKEGKAARKAMEEARKEKLRAKIEAIKTAIVKGVPLTEKDRKDLRKWAEDENKWKIFKHITLRPDRLADAIEGGKNFNGTVHRLLIDDVRDLLAKEIKAKESRLQNMRDIRQKLGISLKELSQTIEIGEYKLTKDQAATIWGMWHDDDSKKALMGGYGLTDEWFQKLDSTLEDKYKKLAKAIIDDYKDVFPLLDEAHLTLTNKRVNPVEWYLPMRRLDHADVENPEVLSKVVEQVYGAGRAKVIDNMMHNRVNMSVEKQTRIALPGVYQQYQQEVGIQEHYIHFANAVRELRAILNNQEIKGLIQNQSKSLYKALVRYTDRVANPQVIWTPTKTSKFIRFVRDNMALSFLSYNFSVILKQLPSLVFYMAKTDLPTMINSLWQTAFKWREIRNFIENADPWMKNRAIIREMEELKLLNSAGVKKVIRKVGLVGMRGIMLADKLATTAGWWAVYQKQAPKVGHEEAIRIARDLTLRTQPSFTASELADVYASEGMAFFVQFTNQLNQIWNMTIYDIPTAFKEHAYYQGAMLSMGIILSGMLIWSITKGRVPKDKKDWINMTSTTFLNMIPIIGVFASRALSGYIPELAAFKPIEAIGGAAGTVGKLLAGEQLTEGQKNQAIRQILEGLAVATGIPYTGSKRAYEAGKTLAEGGDILEALEALAIGKKGK